MRVHTRPISMLAAALAAAGALACSTDATGASAAHSVGFSVSTADATLPLGMRAALMPSRLVSLTSGGSLLITGGADSLRLDSIRVVVRQVMLFNAADSTCGDDGHDDHDDGACKPITAGPQLLKLPLSAGDSLVFNVQIPAGTYTGMSFRVHKPNPSDTAMAGFLAAHPDFANVSIKVDGAFDGTAVHWAGTPTVQVKEKFSPPVLVSDTSGVNFTLRVNVASWFVDQNGALLNPNNSSALSQIINNVNKSFHGFEDDHHNGHDDQKHDGGTSHP